MGKLFKVFSWGLMISALGTLPLGTLNIAAMQISVSEGLRPALLFAFAATLVEIIYVRISLVGMDWVRKQKKLLKWLDWIALTIVLALAIGSFYAASQPSHVKNVFLQNHMNRFLLGLLMSAINPVQIPFWFGWSTVLFTKNILEPKPAQYNLYIIGIGLGSLIGLGVFVFGGKLLVDKLNTNQHLLNYIIGGVFAVTALLQLIKILRHKGLAHSVDKTG
ncbi:MAG: LysE family transporter [Chitinophagaceae bacterium]